MNLQKPFRSNYRKGPKKSLLFVTGLLLILLCCPADGAAAPKTAAESAAAAKAAAPLRKTPAAVQPPIQPPVQAASRPAEKQPESGASSAEPAGQVALLDMVLASIEDEPITISDLREFAEQQGHELPPNVMNGDPKVRQLLRELVLTKLVEREAAASGISVSDEEVNAYIGEIKRQNGVDDQGLTRLLASKGLSYEIYKRQVRDDIFKTRVVGTHVRNRITVTDEEVQRVLSGGKKPGGGEAGEEESADDPAEAVEDRPAGVRLFQIRIPKSGDESASAKQTALSMRKQLEAGETWPKVGNENFTDLGSVAVEELRPELSRAVAGLTDDEVSQPVETADAVYILMKPTADRARLSSTDTPEDRIRQRLYQEKFSAALEKFLNDELPKKYHVELKL